MRVTAILAIALLHCGYHAAAIPMNSSGDYGDFPSVCWDACNSAELERQAMGRCDGPAYKELRAGCVSCANANGGGTKGWDDTLPKTPNCL